MAIDIPGLILVIVVSFGYGMWFGMWLMKRAISGSADTKDRSDETETA